MCLTRMFLSWPTDQEMNEHIWTVYRCSVQQYVFFVFCRCQISWVWVYSVLWKGRNHLQWHLGNSLWWWMGPKRCSGGVQRVELWHSSTGSSVGCVRSRDWTDLARWCELFRQWESSKSVFTQWIWDTQLWTPSGCWCGLFRWENFWIQYFT